MRASLLASRKRCAIAEGISLDGSLGVRGVGSSTVGGLCLHIGKQGLHDSSVQLFGALQKHDVNRKRSTDFHGKKYLGVWVDALTRKAGSCSHIMKTVLNAKYQGR